MYRKISDLAGKLRNKVVCLRIDANVPIVNGVITDDSRLAEAIPSISFLIKGGVSRIFILSHFGRPKPQVKNLEFSLMQIKPHFEKLVGEEIEFCESVENMPNAKLRIVLCENLRYSPGEENGDEEFAKSLVKYCDFYINDAFSCSHRAHASISSVVKFKDVYAGFAMLKEIASIESIVGAKTGKTLAVIGGSKISTKISLLKNLIQKMDYIFIAGAMANTFLYAQGHNIGASLCEKDLKEMALEILQAAEGQCEILLPTDVIVCKKLERSAPSRMVWVSEINDDEIIADAGLFSLLDLIKKLETCKLFLWNGPLGVFEISPFCVSTFMLARAVSKMTSEGKLQSIVGGGDTASAVLASGLKNQMTYVSTAGGAFLEWLEGKTLPGISAISYI